MRLPLVFSICSVLLLVGCVTGSGRLETFRSLNNTPHGFQLVASPVRAGETAQRFEVRPGDCGQDDGWSDCANNRERSELSVGEEISPETVRWISYSVYIPSDFYSSPRVNTTIGQIHQKGGPRGTVRGLPSFPPLLQIEARGNRVDACLHILTGPENNIRDVCRKFSLTTVNAMRGRWTDVMVHLDSRGTGALEIFLNGERKARSTDFIRFRPQYYIVKYGLYRSFVSRHGEPMPTQVAFYDEVRIGKDRSSVEILVDRPVD